jgi:hypothetical protein
MVALHIESNFKVSADSSVVVGFVCVTSGYLEMQKTRGEETPSRVNTLASTKLMGQSSAIVTRYLPGISLPCGSRIGSAVTRGSEKRRSFAPSRYWPPMVTSTVCPAVPPIGIKVSNRGIGKMTDWAEAEGIWPRTTNE